MSILIALVLAVVALPTPFLGVGFLPGVVLQLIALGLVVRTLSAWPANPPKQVKLALATLVVLFAPWAAVPLALVLHAAGVR